MKSVLVIDDEKDIVESIDYNLSKAGFKVYRAFDGEYGLKYAREKKPDLVILDLMLPEIDGMEVCRILKREASTAQIPIIMLTAKKDETDKVVGLESGADDYITKPFSMRELIARVKNIIARYKRQAVPPKSMQYPGLKVDIERHEVTTWSKMVQLTAKEFSLLKFLMEHEGKVFNREALLDQVWGDEVGIESRTIDVHLTSLRKKLGKAGKYIYTIRGVGYKFLKIRR